jgi:hypothetical protein
MKDPNDFFNSTVLLLRDIGETHEWEITVMGEGEKLMSRFTFRGSRREADVMAIEARLSAEVKLEAIARNVKASPGGQTALVKRANDGTRHTNLPRWPGPRRLEPPVRQAARSP